MEEAMCLCACVCTCIPMGIQALARDALSSKTLLIVFLFAVFYVTPRTPPPRIVLYLSRAHTRTHWPTEHPRKKKYNKIKIREDQTNTVRQRLKEHAIPTIKLRQTHASYGIEGMRDRYCAKHKSINMLNLTVRKCEFDGCLAQPTCNRPELKKPR